MSLRRKIFIGLALLIISGLVYVAYSIIYTIQHIPEAYAAWDTGTMLVAYMESHENQWPKSWDDLQAGLISDSEYVVQFRGIHAGESQTKYAQSLRGKVAIDWTFDPRHMSNRLPVTRIDGSKFPIVWSGAEPNQMVRRHLQNSTNAPQSTPSTHEGDRLK